MNPIPMCDDIEEGEIVESSDSSNSNITSPTCKKARKSLPRRYVVEENKKLRSKHKKERKCKHLHRHVNRAKSKVSPVKPKDHKKHKLCTKRDPLNNSVTKIARAKSSALNVKNPEFYGSCLRLEISNSLKTLKDSDKNVEKSLLHSSVSKCNPLSMIDYSMLQDSFNKSCNELKRSGCSENNGIPNINPNPIVSNIVHISSNKLIVDENEKLKTILNASDFAPISVESECKNEESEDEDELRRIALATCAKKSLSENKIEIDKVQVCGVDAVQPLQSNIQPVTDNYEIVDMELDDNVSSADTAENLFVIDTKPSVVNEFNNDVLVSKEDNSKYPPSSKLDEEFEEEFLRAVLLAGMTSQKSTDDDNSVVKNEALEKNKKVEKCISKPKQTDTLPLVHQELKPVTLARKKIDAKVMHPRKTQPNETFQMPQNRIVISLADESSSDDSDAGVENDGPAVTTCVSSLEALICDARKKSDQTKTGAEGSNVSYLSKSQQEEYNLYKKILNASEKEPALINKNNFSHFPKCQLKLKEKKLSIALSNYTKEKNLMTNEAKEVLKKRSAFMKAKLKAQQLKEEFLETKRMMKTNLQLYQKSINHLKTLKKSVMKREELIRNLKAECTDLGVSIEGKNYVLPAISDQALSLVDKTNSC